MSGKEKLEETPGMKVFRKLEESKKRIRDMKEDAPKYIPGEPSPYIDTQLFPEKKPLYHE
jgi:hypothetical protein